MTDLAELRRLAEQAIASRTEFGDLPIDYEFRVSVDPAAILSLLDELDAAQHVGDNCGRVLEQTAKRVAALEEGLRAVLDTEFTLQVSGHDVECDLIQSTRLPCSCGFSEARRKATSLLQASAQDASEGSGK